VTSKRRIRQAMPPSLRNVLDRYLHANIQELADSMLRAQVVEVAVSAVLDWYELGTPTMWETQDAQDTQV
jgi:hypothetical protein